MPANRFVITDLLSMSEEDVLEQLNKLLDRAEMAENVALSFAAECAGKEIDMCHYKEKWLESLAHVERLEEAVNSLVECDTEDGYADSWHSPTCRKCAALGKETV